MPRVYGKDTELNQKIVSGVKKLSEAVSVTLGPKGRNVIIHQKGKAPFITKDGVTVAGHVHLEDVFENLGAQVLKQVSQRTVEDCGDGTTTSTVLAGAILIKSQKYITAGSSPTDVKRGMEKAVEAITKELKNIARPISTLEEIESIAKISANGDSKIAKLIATAIDKAGVDGAVSIEDGRAQDTTLDIVEGFQFDAGYLSPQFITDERKGSMRYENALVLVCDSVIDNIEELLPILEVAARENKPFIIVSEGVEGQALAALIMNAVRGTMKVAAIKAPRYGMERKNLLSDLAVSVGATFITRENGMLLKEANRSHLGMVKSVESLKSWSTFVGGKGNAEDIEKRIESLKAQIEQTDDLDECRRIQDRITRLASGVAIIRVGGVTEVDMIERKHRIEDALAAVKSAQEEGILPGGGVALLRAASKASVQTDNHDEQFGVQVIVEACQEPARKIAENCGLKPDIIIETLLDKNRCSTDWTGFDFANEEYVNMDAAGVVDPAKVTRCALQNAVSAASTLMTTFYAIVET
jgi:chaperonin GroEL